MNRSLKFKLPVDLTIEQLLAHLNDKMELQLVSQRLQTKTYYDSFDWRLYNCGMICELVAEKLLLKTFKNDLVITSAKLAKVPRFVQQFECPTLRQQLEPILEMRALLLICTVSYQAHQFNVVNEDKKIVLRLSIEQYEQFRHRVLLQPLKGYDHTTEQIIELLTKLGCTVTTTPLLIAALRQQGRKINDYSSKLNIELNPNTPADIAAKIIYRQLLTTIKANEQGTIADIDSEFLHDFRVAVRRTRSALSQLKSVLPENISTHYAKFFSGLSKITSDTRDLDVYLLNFERYQNSLPRPVRPYLNPLQDFLRQKQQHAQQQLANNLRSADYRTTLAAWKQYLKEPVTSPSKLSIKRLVNKRIRKNYQRVMQEGTAITELSPCEQLHELRKSCKKLRYLLEFFQSLYNKKEMNVLLKTLKALQDVLGSFQDCTVQISQLHAFSAELRQLNTPDETLLAIELLIENLNTHQIDIRSHFAEQFAQFAEQEIQTVFESLFA